MIFWYHSVISYAFITAIFLKFTYISTFFIAKYHRFYLSIDLSFLWEIAIIWFESLNAKLIYIIQANRLVSYRTVLCLIISNSILSCQILSHRVKYCLIMSNSILSCQILSYHVKFYLIMSNSILSCQILSYLLIIPS